MIEQGESAGLCIDLSGKMINAVGDHQVPDTVIEVIIDDLIEDLLAEFHLLSLALNYHHRLPGTVMDQDVSPAQHRMKPERGFDADESGRITKIPGQVTDKMLPHPLLGSESHILPPQRVIEEFSPRTLFYAQ